MGEIKKVQEDILEVEHQIQKLLIDFQNKHQLEVYNLGFTRISFLGQYKSMPIVELEVHL